jgi:hypothetical protein
LYVVHTDTVALLQIFAKHRYSQGQLGSP